MRRGRRFPTPCAPDSVAAALGLAPLSPGPPAAAGQGPITPGGPCAKADSAEGHRPTPERPVGTTATSSCHRREAHAPPGPRGSDPGCGPERHRCGETPGGHRLCSLPPTLVLFRDTINTPFLVGHQPIGHGHSVMQRGRRPQLTSCGGSTQASKPGQARAGTGAQQVVPGGPVLFCPPATCFLYKAEGQGLLTSAASPSQSRNHKGRTQPPRRAQRTGPGPQRTGEVGRRGHRSRRTGAVGGWGRRHQHTWPREAGRSSERQRRPLPSPCIQVSLGPW